MDFLPLGTIVTIKQDENNAKLMIVRKLAVQTKNEHDIGYFDYAACVYPYGVIGDEFYFINEADIDQVIFKGYEDDEDKELNEYLTQKLKEIDYSHLYNELPKYSEKEDLTDLLSDD